MFLTSQTLHWTAGMAHAPALAFASAKLSAFSYCINPEMRISSQCEALNCTCQHLALKAPALAMAAMCSDDAQSINKYLTDVNASWTWSINDGFVLELFDGFSTSDFELDIEQLSLITCSATCVIVIYSYFHNIISQPTHIGDTYHCSVRTQQMQASVGYMSFCNQHALFA